MVLGDLDGLMVIMDMGKGSMGESMLGGLGLWFGEDLFAFRKLFRF